MRRRTLALVLAVAALLAPAAASAQTAGPKLNARAWALIDARDGELLAGQGTGQRVPIASATKLMTAHLALERLEPDQKLVAPAYQALAVESVIGLRAGERMTVRDLLYALILESANDAAVTIAKGVSGSTKAFVAEMNREAQELGLSETHYSNPIGLDSPDNYSTAKDLITLARELREEPLFAKVADTPQKVLRSGDSPRQIDTRNVLLNQAPYVDGIKTGHTLGAGWVLVGSATQAGTTLLSAVLRAPSEAARDSETLKLLRYGFSLYRVRTPVRADEEVADPKLDYRDQRLGLVAEHDLTVSARQGQAVRTRIEAPDEVDGPVEQGERLGKVEVLVDGEVAAREPLVAASAASAASLTDKVVATAQNPMLLLPLGAFVIVVGMLLAARGRRSSAAQVAGQRTAEERRRMQEERTRKRQGAGSGRGFGG